MATTSAVSVFASASNPMVPVTISTHSKPSTAPSPVLSSVAGFKIDASNVGHYFSTIQLLSVNIFTLVNRSGDQ